MPGINVAALVATLTLESTQFENALHAMEVKTTSFGQKISNFGGQLTKVGGAMTAGITLPVVAAGKAIIDTGQEFEYQMAKLNTVAELPKDQLWDLEKQIRTLGVASGLGATEIAKQAYDVVGAMDDTPRSVEILEASLNLAVSTGGDLGSVLAAIVGVTKAYGAESGTAREVADKLFTTVDKGVVSIEQLTSNIGYGVGTAALAGVSLDEFLGSIVGLTRGSLSGATAVNSLNRLLLGIIKPSESAQKVAKEYGIELSATALEAHGLGGMLELINEKTGGNVEAIAKLFPLVQGFRGEVMLSANELALYNEGMAGMGESTDRINRALDGIFNTTKQNGAVMKASLEELKIAWFQGMEEPLAKVIDWLTRFFLKLSTVSPEVMELAIKIAVIAAAAGPVLLVLGSLITVLGALISPVGAVLAVIALLLAGFLKLTEGTGILKKAMEGDWAAVWEIIRSSCDKVATKIETWAAETWVKIKAWADNTLTAIDNWAYGVLVAIDTWKFRTVLAFELWCASVQGKIEGWVDNTLTAIDNWAYGVLVAIDTWKFRAALAFELWCADVQGKIETWVTNTTTKIGAWVTETGTTIGTWVTNTSTAIGTWVTNTATAMGTWVSNRITEFGTLATEAIGKVTSIVTETAAQAGAALQAGLDLGKNIIQGIINGIESLLSTAITIAKGIISKIKGAMYGEAEAHSPAQAFVPLGENIVQGVIEGMAATAPKAMAEAQKLINGLEAAMSPAGAFLELRSRTMGDMRKNLLAEGRTMPSSIYDLAATAAKMIVPMNNTTTSAKYMALSGPDFGPSGMQFNFYNSKITDEDSAKTLLTEAARKLRLMGVTV